jgi:hypothetical protein
MIKKDMYFAVTKHWILIIPLIIIIITTSLQPDVEKPIIALSGNLEAQIEGEIHETLKIERITSTEEGIHMVERSIVDAFVLVEDSRILIFRNDRSLKSYYVRPAIKKAVTTSPIQIEYIGNENSIKKELFSLFFLFIFVGFGMPALLFQDDKDVINALLLSPVKNRTIVMSKLGTAVVLLVLLGFFYLLYIDTVKLNLFVVIVVIGLNCTALGTLFGIFYDNKYVSLLIYPIMLFFMILFLFPNPLSDWITEIMNSVFFSSKIPLVPVIILLLTFAGLLLLTFVFFGMKIKMKRVKG